MRSRSATSLAAAVLSTVVAASCGSGDVDPTAGLTVCENDIVVYEGVDCASVLFDMDRLDGGMSAEIDALEQAARDDPAMALPNAQRIQRLLASTPPQVCDALQTDPTGEFLTTESIAPIAAELSESVCPSLTQLLDLGFTPEGAGNE